MKKLSIAFLWQDLKDTHWCYMLSLKDLLKSFKSFLDYIHWSSGFWSFLYPKMWCFWVSWIIHSFQNNPILSSEVLIDLRCVTIFFTSRMSSHMAEMWINPRPLYFHFWGYFFKFLIPYLSNTAVVPKQAYTFLKMLAFNSVLHYDINRSGLNSEIHTGNWINLIYFYEVKTKCRNYIFLPYYLKDNIIFNISFRQKINYIYLKLFLVFNR